MNIKGGDAIVKKYVVIYLLLCLILTACGGTKETTRVKDGKFTFSESQFVENAKQILKDVNNNSVSLGDLKNVSGKKTCDIYIDGEYKNMYYAFSSTADIVDDMALIIEVDKLTSDDSKNIMAAMELMMMTCDPSLTVDTANTSARSLVDNVTIETQYETINDVQYGMEATSDYSKFIMVALPIDNN